MGFFSSFFSAVEDIGGGFLGAIKGGVQGAGQAVNRAADAIAEPLGVHPDVVKAAAALAGFYYSDAGVFVDLAGETVADAVVAEAIAPTLAAESAAAASAAAPAAAATAIPVATAPLGAMGAATPFTATDLAALGAESLAVPAATNALAPAAATAAGANALTGLSPETLAAISGAEGLAVPANALTGAASAAATGATLAPTFDPASALETQLTVTPAATTNALMPTFDPSSAMETQLTAVPDTTGLPPGAFDTLAKFAKDYGVPLSSLISGITGSQAARDAANVQAESAREARQLARDIFNEQKALQEPFRTAGVTAQNQLLTLLGLQGGTQGAEFGRYARPFGMQDFQADPGYAFRLSEGMKALEASRAAKGGLLSGATGKALSRYGQDLASQEYGNAFNRFQTERVNRLQPLGSLMATGQAAASNQGAAAGQYGTTAGNLTTDIGAVTAGGQLGSARAISNALSAYTNYLGNQNLAQAIRESQYNR